MPVGQGATSEVWLAHDRDFDRDVAIKYLPPRPGTGVDNRFLREARITAGLEHPNVVPVHDLGRSADGGLYMVMRHISGRSLGERIREAIDQARAEVLPLDEVVTIYRKVCDAIAFAHSRGIIHRDIKPDNIMLGDYGEVMLVDWGAASESAGDPQAKGLVGTPAFMSPEQARGEGLAETSDVYNLGASLFHTLYLRLPLFTSEGEEYWARKRAGGYDPPGARESARIPKPLRAVIAKAMEPEPAKRYATIRALAADLQAWQAGLAVSVWRDPFTVRAARWHRRHWRGLWVGVAAATAALAFAWNLYGQWLQETATWGRAIISEDFVGDTWRDHWTETEPGAFTSANGHLVSTAARGAYLVCNRRLSGSAAIEFDGKIQDGALPGDLSVLWCDGKVFGDARPRIEGDGIRTVRLQVGANDNVAALIITEPGYHRESYRRFHLEPGRTYRIRVEVDGGHLAMLVDGQTVATYDDLFPFTSGYFCLYGYYPGKVFDHVRIYGKGVARKVSALAIGDAFYEKGDFVGAAGAYERIVESQPGTDLADQALFRQGLCQLLLGRWDDACAHWGQVRDPQLLLQVALHTLDHLDATGKDDERAARFLALYDANPDLREALRNHWRGWVDRRLDDPPDTLKPLLALQEKAFPNEADSNEAASRLLQRLGRWDDSLTRFPDDPAVRDWALFQLGRIDELITRHDTPAEAIIHCTAQLEAGRFADADEVSKRADWLRQPMLLEAGRDQDYIQDFGDNVRLWLCHGRADAVIAGSAPERWEYPVAELQQGHLGSAIDHARAALATGVTPPGWIASPRDVLTRLLVRAGMIDDAMRVAREWDQRHLAYAGAAIEAARAGDGALAQDRLGELGELPATPIWPCHWFEHLVVVPALADPARTPAAPVLHADAVRRALATADPLLHEQRPWHFARLVLGQESEADFLAQPDRLGVEGRLRLATALRHDLAGEAAAAVADYHAWLALPAYQRGVDGVEGVGDPLPYRFVLWRLSARGHPEPERVLRSPDAAPAPATATAGSALGTP
jgi:tetratricopeptide (TPR) repeat protein